MLLSVSLSTKCFTRKAQNDRASVGCDLLFCGEYFHDQPIDRPTKYEVFGFKRELIRCQDRKGEPRSTKRDRLMQLGLLKVIGNGNIR